MHKSAVGFAVGRLMQVMGVVLIVPLGISIWDYRSLPVGEIITASEFIGFIVAILLALVFGTILVVLYRSGRELQGIKEGYAIVTLGWVVMAFLAASVISGMFLY